MKELIKRVIQLSPYYLLVRKWCENIITPPFQFDHLPTQVSKSPYRLKVSESAVIFAHLQTCLSRKSPKLESFLFKSIFKLEL